MPTLDPFDNKPAAAARPLLGSNAVRFIAYLGLCAAYLQGGLVKLTDRPGAQPAQPPAENQRRGAQFQRDHQRREQRRRRQPELHHLRDGALALAGFTVPATGLALRFRELPAGQARFMVANAFFEHLGLVGGFLLVARLDLREKTP